MIKRLIGHIKYKLAVPKAKRLQKVLPVKLQIIRDNFYVFVNISISDTYAPIFAKLPEGFLTKLETYQVISIDEWNSHFSHVPFSAFTTSVEQTEIALADENSYVKIIFVPTDFWGYRQIISYWATLENEKSEILHKKPQFTPELDEKISYADSLRFERECILEVLYKKFPEREVK